MDLGVYYLYYLGVLGAPRGVGRIDGCHDDASGLEADCSVGDGKRQGWFKVAVPLQIMSFVNPIINASLLPGLGQQWNGSRSERRSGGGNWNEAATAEESRALAYCSQTQRRATI